MKYLLHIIALCLLLAGCGRNSEIDRQLDRADALIESRPDSSLLILDNIDANALSGKEQKARYALLKSMAFDKNYIDTTTFDVLQPAIDYYLEHGTPNEKLRTYYYQGVIFNNQGNRDNALNSFSKAIDLENTITDLYVLARAYAAQGYLYDQLYALEDGLKSNLEASRIYNRISQNYKEFDCLLRAYNEAIILNDKPLADSLSSVCNNFAINDSIEAGKLWQQNLHYASKFGDKEEIRIMLSQQEHSLPFNPDKLMDLALAYNKLGNNEYALELLDIVRASNSEYNGLRLLSVQLPIYKGIGNFKDALSIYEKYSIAYDSINLKKFEYLTQTIQARNKIEIQAQKEAERNTRIIWSCIGGLVILVLLVGVLLLTVRNKQSEKALAIQIARTKEAENAQLKTEQERLALEAENLAHRVDTLEEESRSLKELMATSVELPEEVQKAIQVRIEMLNSGRIHHIK